AERRRTLCQGPYAWCRTRSSVLSPVLHRPVGKPGPLNGRMGAFCPFLQTLGLSVETDQLAISQEYPTVHQHRVHVRSVPGEHEGRYRPVADGCMCSAEVEDRDIRPLADLERTDLGFEPQGLSASDRRHLDGALCGHEVRVVVRRVLDQD